MYAARRSSRCARPDPTGRSRGGAARPAGAPLGGCLQQPLGGRLDVVQENPAARSGPRHCIDGRRRSRAPGGARPGLPEPDAHRPPPRAAAGAAASGCAVGSRGRGPALGGLGQAAARAARPRAPWSVDGLRGGTAGVVSARRRTGRLQTGDGIAHSNGVARLDMDGGHHPGFRGGHLHHCLVGLQLHQRVRPSPPDHRGSPARRATSPASMFSPSSGSLTSIGIVPPPKARLTPTTDLGQDGHRTPCREPLFERRYHRWRAIVRYESRRGGAAARRSHNANGRLTRR